MSQGAQVDYDALAKQYGATSAPSAGVDYDALARQHGAVTSTRSGLPAPNPMGLANRELAKYGIQVGPPQSGVNLPEPGIVDRFATAAANALPIATAEERT